ncbi:MAG TPA: FtsX-like permease family protein [Candidatus Krumholzibacteria bacterium]|nr:FtsX-like permease family protein [Candidatus Krumholzibacteria bacterium]HPD70691.1 FtsX-like permease family protein [Candidatus Krumholzibacteria bacterium]HRY39609.1 FtsX-like permease family protein [Candidatus Krumholzibacteria bacterium]
MNVRLLNAGLAHWRQARTLTLLTVCGVALGVASVVCIQTLNLGALAAFGGGVKAVSGEADLVVLGQGPDLAESVYPAVLAESGVAAAWPLVRAWVRVERRPATYLEILGVDVFAPVSFPVRLGGEGLARFDGLLAEPGWIALTPEFARELDLAVRDTLSVATGDRTVGLVIGALVDFRAHAPLASAKLGLMDISQAQSWFGRRGRVSQIDVKVAAGRRPADVAAALERALGPGVRVLTPDQRAQDATGLLAAFRLNLTALSLISVLVGVFLIFSAVHASLVRRRRDFGLLRSLGASRGQLLGMILLEVALLGLAGTALGLPLGFVTARQNVDAVSATLTSIYLLSEIEQLTLPPLLVAIAVAVGLGGALLGALLPALDIARRDPVALLGAAGLPERLSRLAPRFALAGLVLVAAVVAWYAGGGRRLKESGFVLAFFLMVVLPLLTPLFLRELCGRLPPGGFGWRLGLRGLASRLQSTSFAVAALAVTVAMLVGITLLIGSFRATLDTWIQDTLQADIYVTGASWDRDHGATWLSEEVVALLAGFDGVRAADRQRRISGRTTDGRALRLAAFRRTGEAGPRQLSRVPLLAGDPERVERALRDDGACVITEPLARHAGLAVGDTLRLAGADGPVPLPIAGIGYDYSTEGGLVFLGWPTLDAVYGPGGTSSLALTLARDRDVDATLDAMRAALAGRAVELRSNRRLRAEVLDIFDQTFAVTRILQAMALVIAVAGVSLTLLIMGRERATEFALYRSLGATRRQLVRLGLGEGAGLGLLGFALGLAGGAVLAAILILLINRDWFGWTIRFELPASDLAVQAAWILAGALAAAVYPALRSSRTPVAELTREDLL